MTCGRYMGLWPRWQMALWISQWKFQYFYSWMIFCNPTCNWGVHMVEGDHDGDSASITIELLNVIEITSCFFLPATKCFKYLFTVIRRTLFNGPIFIFVGIQIIQQEWTLMFYAVFYGSSMAFRSKSPVPGPLQKARKNRPKRRILLRGHLQ